MCKDFPCITSCSTGALQPFLENATPRIGMAIVSEDGCYMAQGQPCDYCTKYCPETPKAIDTSCIGQSAKVNSQLCTGCGQCAQICPANSIQIEDRRKNVKVFSFITCWSLLFFFVSSFFLLDRIEAQEEEEEEEKITFQKQAALFSQKCSKCHTVGKGDRVGPDLKNVSKNRERRWILGFIRQPSQYLKSDPIAKELLKQYGDVVMPDLNLTTKDAGISP